MKSRTKIIISAIAYVVFMIYFTAQFLPVFYEATGGNEMIDAYLADYSKSIADMENLIIAYGETGRAFMVNFFMADSLYIIISVLFFSFLIQALTNTKYLRYIPFVTGAFDTIENIIVLYSTSSLNFDYLLFARIFATAKGVTLFSSLLIILVGLIRMVIKGVRRVKKNPS
ncbi:MAG: hypothetical protein PQJ59_05945 [Spirochaetales bacterium]|nr:hypothetical protein [Spirochaetales bacterium]